MIFPDARQRVPTPAFSTETLDGLKRRDYKPAVVELAAHKDLSFSFLRPPRWEVGPPVLSPAVAMPMPPLASFTRKDPPAAVELLLYDTTYDCLPGDFLDAALDGLRLSHRSEGPLGDGWYADRMGRAEAGYEILAGHRKGKDLFLFLCAMPVASVPLVRDEVATLVGTFGLKQKRPHLYADRWRKQDDVATGLSFAVPEDAQVERAAFGLEARWPLEAGTVKISVRPVLPKEAGMETVEAGLRKELLGRGVRLGVARVGDLPATPGGVFAGNVSIRLYQSMPSSSRAIEALLLVGARKDGGAVRVVGVYPSRETHAETWMRARFALVQIAATMKAKPLA